MSEPMNIADELVASMQEAVEIVAGRMEPGRVWSPPASVNVARVRQRTGLSQVAFAARYGFSPGAVRDWEQGRRQPEKAARTLMLIIEREPEAVERALQVA